MWKDFFPERARPFLGGDLNLDRNRNSTEEGLYDDIIDDQGFNDAYADFIIANSDPPNTESLVTLCEDKDDPDEHCTVDVTPLGGPGSRRIDYILTKNFGKVTSAQVVFNTDVDPAEPTVSDHAAVVTSLELP